MLKSAAATAPLRGITIYDSNGRTFSRRSYPEILAAASDIAQRWSASGITPGDRLLIALPTSWAWVDSWLGALFAGAIPAAAPPAGSLGSGRSDIDRIVAMAQKLGAMRTLVSESFREQAMDLGLNTFAETAIIFKELTSVSSGV